MPLQQLGGRPGSSGSQVSDLLGTRAAHAASADVSSSPATAAAAPTEGQLLAPKAGDPPGTAPAASRPGAPIRGKPTAPAIKAGASGHEDSVSARRPGAPSRENIVAALRKLIEGLDTEDDYELCLDKVRRPHSPFPFPATPHSHSACLRCAGTGVPCMPDIPCPLSIWRSTWQMQQCPGYDVS